MATPVYIESAGIFCESYPSLSALRLRTPAHDEKAFINPNQYFEPVRVRLQATRELDREDRSILNTVSTLAVNAVDDAISGLQLIQPLEAFSESPIFIGSDEAEHQFVALNEVVKEESFSGSVYAGLASLSQRVNPLDLLRQLSTNAAYHVSKRLKTQGGAYPLRAASLSGLVALEEAIDWLNAGNDRTATVVGACNMRSFDAMLSFRKLGALKDTNQSQGVPVSYGAACLLLSRRIEAESTALGIIIGARSHFSPQAHSETSTWVKMYQQAIQDWGLPDYVVRYSVGLPSIDGAESSAFDRELFGIPSFCYKPLFGYTGKANNLLDSIAALTDERILPNKKVLIAGIGMGYGIGSMVIKKGGQLDG